MYTIVWCIYSTYWCRRYLQTFRLKVMINRYSIFVFAYISSFVKMRYRVVTRTCLPAVPNWGKPKRALHKSFSTTKKSKPSHAYRLIQRTATFLLYAILIQVYVKLPNLKNCKKATVRDLSYKRFELKEIRVYKSQYEILIKNLESKETVLSIHAQANLTCSIKTKI